MTYEKALELINNYYVVNEFDCYWILDTYDINDETKYIVGAITHQYNHRVRMYLETQGYNTDDIYPVIICSTKNKKADKIAFVK